MTEKQEGTNTNSVAAIALARAISAISPVKKTKDNPFFKHKYADLNSVLEAIEGPLHDNGLSVSQWPDKEGLITRATHLDSGLCFQCTTPIPYEKLKPQEVGSWITYMRRYALVSIFCIPQEDDDGNAAQKGTVNSELGKKAAETYQKDIEKIGSFDALVEHYKKHRAMIQKLPKTYRDEIQDLFIIQKEKIASA